MMQESRGRSARTTLFHRGHVRLGPEERLSQTSLCNKMVLLRRPLMRIALSARLIFVLHWLSVSHAAASYERFGYTSIDDPDPVAGAIVRDLRETIFDSNGVAAQTNVTQFSLSSLHRRLKGRAVGRENPLEGMSDVQWACPWSLTVTAKTYNVAFPDLNCVYQVILFWGLSGKRMLRVEGQFPRVRYFSYQSYDLSTAEPIASLIDYQIEAVKGINPYRRRPLLSKLTGESDEVDNEEEVSGAYQIHITSSGKEGMPNELRAATSGALKQCSGSGCLALVILRLYTADIGSDAFRADDPARLWGYVAKPSVSLRYGEQLSSWLGLTIEAYHQLPDCDPNKKTLTQVLLERRLSTLKNNFEPMPLDNKDDNFVLFRAEKTERALFPNADANYLFATAMNNRTSEGLQLVTRISGRLPVTPKGLFVPPYTGDRLSYEARYVSLSTIALKGGGPVIDTLTDTAIEDKYAGQSERWRERSFSVVAGPSDELLRSCPAAVYNPSHDLFLTTSEHDTSQPAYYQGFVYRQILSRWQLTGRRDKSVALAKHECTGSFGNLCQLRSFFERLMGNHYPRIKYLYCSFNDGCRCWDSSGKEIRGASEWSFMSSADSNSTSQDQSKGPGTSSSVKPLALQTKEVKVDLAARANSTVVAAGQKDDNLTTQNPEAPSNGQKKAAGSNMSDPANSSTASISAQASSSNITENDSRTVLAATTLQNNTLQPDLMTLRTGKTLANTTVGVKLPTVNISEGIIAFTPTGATAEKEVRVVQRRGEDEQDADDIDV